MPTQLTTLNNVKEWVGSQTSDDDALLTRLISAASAWIENYLNRTLGLTTYQRNFDGAGGYRMMLPEYPVTQVISVSVDGVGIMPAADQRNLGYVFDSNSVSLRGYLFMRGVGNVQVSWIAGYNPIPDDIEQAAIHLVAARYREKDRIGETSKVIQGMQVNFSIRDMPPDVASIFRSYRKVVPV